MTADAGAGGMGGEPALEVDAVETWGGKPLNMVPFATSGTRLEALGYTDDDAVFFAKLRDTELGFDCAFEQSEAGDFLCAPLQKQALVYLDADCTEPAVEKPAHSTPTGEYFGVLSSPSASSGGGADTVLLPTHSPVYRIAEEVFASNGVDTYAEDTLTLYTSSSAGECVGPRVANPHVVARPPSIFRVTPVSDSELIKAATRQVALEDGLTLERLVTQDGAQLSGHLAFAGRQCELQRDGRCVPAPVAPRALFADANCEEYTFELPTGLSTGTPVYGVEPALDDTSTVYELSLTTTVYARRFGGGCEAIDVSNDRNAHYRRARDVTEQFPKLNIVELGAGRVLPSWFFSLLAGTNTKVLVQMHSPDGDWVKPNFRTSDGSVCAVYDASYKDRCLLKDGLSSLAVTPVRL